MRRIRLWSGIVLFAYLFSHLINHALGLANIATAEAGLRAMLVIWHSRMGTVLLYGAALAHFALALRTLFLRANWKLPVIEIIRLGAGFTLPWLLIGHAITARLAAHLYPIPANYTRIVSDLVASGNQGWQFALLAPGWLHGCLGLWISLRRYDWAKRHRRLIAGLALMLPLCSAGGFWRMAREIATQPAAYMSTLTPAERMDILFWRNAMTRNYLLLIAATALAGMLWRYWQSRRAISQS